MDESRENKNWNENQNQELNARKEPLDLQETEIREINTEQSALQDTQDHAPLQQQEAWEDVTQNSVEETNAQPVQEPMQREASNSSAPLEKEISHTSHTTQRKEQPRANHTAPKGANGCYQEKVKKTKKKQKGWAKLVAGCLIVSLVGGPGIGAGYALMQHHFATEEVTNQPTKDGGNMIVQQTSSRTDLSVIDVVSNVKPSVVSITTKIEGVTQYYGAFRMPYQGEGAGSGVIFHSDEEKIAIVTNNHVVSDAKEVYATIDDKASVKAKVVGTKEDSDLAVLTISWADLKAAGIDEVTAAEFGDSDQLQVGESVVAIGNAMGQGLSATDGIISMKNQTIALQGNPLNVIQTSAAINSGNSGGALVNRKGQVIGINTAKYNSEMTEGMGYAIPSNEVASIAQDLLEDGTVETPYIGIVGTSISAENASLYKLPVGALIMEVAEASPAQHAGIEAGDIITEFNGKKVMDMQSLSELVKKTTVGQTVSVHLIRNGETGMDVHLTIADKNA